MPSLSRAQRAALSAAVAHGAVKGHSMHTFTSRTLEGLARRGMLAEVPQSESGGIGGWYRPTEKGAETIAAAGPMECGS